MRPQFFLLYILFSISTYSQSQEHDESIIRADFSSMQAFQPTSLIPFCKDGKWGLLNKSNRLVVVPARYSSLSFFNPNMLAGSLNNRTIFYVDSTRKLHIGSVGPDINEPEFKLEITDEKEFISSGNNYKGFRLNNKGELTALSDIYDKCCFYQVIKIHNKSYLIVSKNKYFGIIDTLGNSLTGFDFVHKGIQVNPYPQDKLHQWFFVTTDGQSWSIQNDLGEIRFKNQLPSNSSYSPFVKEKFGYVIFSKSNATELNCGIFDCRELKWVIEPQNRYDLIDLEFSSIVTLDIGNPSDRAKADIYVCIKISKSEYYFANLNLMVYRPVN